MEPNKQTADLLNQTIQAFSGDTQSVSPTDGVSLIDNWISALHSGDASTNPIANTLSELKAELQRSTPNHEMVQELLDQLATQAEHASEATDGSAQASLHELSQVLQNFSQQLSGNNVAAQTGGQAPITMTSTTTQPSVAGVYSTDIDDQTGSNGGAIGEGQPYAQQAPDAGNTQGGGSYGSGYGTGSEGKDDTPNSGTHITSDSDNKRVGGESTSGGSSDTDTGMSSPGAGGKMPVM